MIDTVYEWIEFLKQAQEVQEIQQRERREQPPTEVLGQFIQASARLERVIYSAMKKAYPNNEYNPRRVYPIEELHRLSLIDDNILRDLNNLRALRNRAVHALPGDDIQVTDRDVKRLHQIVDEIEQKLKQ